MQPVRIIVEYHNNVSRKTAIELKLDCINLRWIDLISTIKEGLQQYVDADFELLKLRVKDKTDFHSIVLENPIVTSDENDHVLVVYSDITALNNSAHLDIDCTLKNGTDVVFDIFPKEGNHRFTPHVLARLGNQTIRIVISDTPSILEPGRFSGNNRKYERTIIEFVGENRDYFLAKWNEMVEVQFS